MKIKFILIHEDFDPIICSTIKIFMFNKPWHLYLYIYYTLAHTTSLWNSGQKNTFFSLFSKTADDREKKLLTEAGAYPQLPKYAFLKSEHYNEKDEVHTFPSKFSQNLFLRWCAYA